VSWPECTDHQKFWMLRSQKLRLDRGPLWMGIVNITPDSFSDGGSFLEPQAAVDRAKRLVDEGADLLDLGGESSRPGSKSVSIEAEKKRVLPVLEKLVGQIEVPISIDTTKAELAGAALDCGAEIINDITALAGDPAMEELIVEQRPGVCLMHMRGTPSTMQKEPVYGDVLAEVIEYLAARRDRLIALGLPVDRICLDPGIGFGKLVEHNLALLGGIGELKRLGCPVLIGHSRKGYIGQLIGAPNADRTPGTIGTALAVARQGASIIRVHDMAAVRQAWKLFVASGG
jgi:dihydropteroate synthase